MCKSPSQSYIYPRFSTGISAQNIPQGGGTKRRQLTANGAPAKYYLQDFLNNWRDKME